MPLLQIQTNRVVDPDTGHGLLTRASELVAQQLSKPEQYVMVNLEAEHTMLFAGSDAPLAFLQLKSIGLPESRTAELSSALCEFIHKELDIDPGRVYIEFIDAPRKMWGWNGATF